jgi:uncharacterized protein (DUF924 family)
MPQHPEAPIRRAVRVLAMVGELHKRGYQWLRVKPSMDLDHDLDKNRRLFLYIPFEHSEYIADQQRAVELIGGLDDGELLHYAVAHRDIIARYGRFPHRNMILGRASTPEEMEFIEQSGDWSYLRRK